LKTIRNAKKFPLKSYNHWSYRQNLLSKGLSNHEVDGFLTCHATAGSTLSALPSSLVTVTVSSRAQRSGVEGPAVVGVPQELRTE
jgi:hypothetical protein